MGTVKFTVSWLTITDENSIHAITLDVQYICMNSLQYNHGLFKPLGG